MKQKESAEKWKEERGKLSYSKTPRHFPLSSFRFSHAVLALTSYSQKSTLYRLVCRPSSSTTRPRNTSKIALHWCRVQRCACMRKSRKGKSSAFRFSKDS